MPGGLEKVLEAGLRDTFTQGETRDLLFSVLISEQLKSLTYKQRTNPECC